ncbi:MAG: transcription antitermination factor NusB [Brevinema sp.]
MNTNKISARRYGRLLAVLTLKHFYISGERKNIDTFYNEVAQTYGLQNLPSSIQKQILSFCQELLDAIEIHFEVLVKTINSYSRNRDWQKFSPLDQGLLLVGAYDLGHNNSTPKICIKEILIISDLLNNEHAVPYISGILKTIAYGNNTDNIDRPFKKRPKIRLKKNHDTQ